MSTRVTVLVLCTGNSCRSQMAHGFLSHFMPDAEIYSAGVEVHGVNPRAVDCMAEVDIDISNHTSNHVDEYLEIKFDYVITVCDNAKETCPVISGDHNKVHHVFGDPSKVQGNVEEIAKAFRSTREEIRKFCKQFSQLVA